MTMTYSRDDVQRHGDSGRTLPAVNVKVHAWPLLTDQLMSTAAHDVYGATVAGFNLAWAEALGDDHLDRVFWSVCEFEFEMIEADAAEVFGHPVKVWREGRSGGWAVVEGLPDLEDWDAVQLGKWRKFERLVRSVAADIPYQIASSLLCNEWEAASAVADASKDGASE